MTTIDELEAEAKMLGSGDAEFSARLCALGALVDEQIQACDETRKWLYLQWLGGVEAMSRCASSNSADMILGVLNHLIGASQVMVLLDMEQAGEFVACAKQIKSTTMRLLEIDMHISALQEREGSTLN
jgi:hypothetical protein